jgi:hypothetical protein
MLTGTDKDPNTCQYCNKSFSRANEFALHYQEIILRFIETIIKNNNNNNNIFF